MTQGYQTFTIGHLTGVTLYNVKTKPIEHMALTLFLKMFVQKLKLQQELISCYAPPALSGGETRITPSPRTKSIGIFLLVDCKDK